MKFLVETSARHVHLTQEHIETLFGAGATLTHKKDLSQPGQFACEERVTLRGPKGEMKNVIVLGPARPDTQVEVSATDARSLGVVGTLRESGDVVIRVKDSFKLAMHIDTDESNASFASGEVYGEIVKL